jgi:hypothetical protein
MKRLRCSSTRRASDGPPKPGPVYDLSDQSWFSGNRRFSGIDNLGPSIRPIHKKRTFPIGLEARVTQGPSGFAPLPAEAMLLRLASLSSAARVTTGFVSLCNAPL